MSKTRGERRDINERKWVSRLKKIFYSGYRTIVMPIKQSKWSDFDSAKTYDELKEDKFGVILKHTGTPCSDKKLTKQEEHKRNIENRKISKEELEEANEYIENQNNPFYFENFCGACDNFNTDECPYLDKVNEETRWKEDIKCEKFYD